MNAANLQLEGLLIAVTGINQALVAKGVLTTEEVDCSLALTEQTILGEDRLAEDLSPANCDAIAFPIPHSPTSHGQEYGRGQEVPPFGELARMVGEPKGRHNDQE